MSKRSRSSVLVALLCAGFIFATPSQSEGYEYYGEFPFLTLGATTAGFPLTSTGLSIYYWTRNSSGGEFAVVLARYLRENATAVTHDLHLGGGETTRDLAMILDVPPEAHHNFADLLRANRRELAPLVSAEAGVAEARQFARVLAVR